MYFKILFHVHILEYYLFMNFVIEKKRVDSIQFIKLFVILLFDFSSICSVACWLVLTNWLATRIPAPVSCDTKIEE